MRRLTYLPTPDPYRTRHVLHRLFAGVLKDGIELAGKVIMDGPRNADAARLGQPLQRGCKESFHF